METLKSHSVIKNRKPGPVAGPRRRRERTLPRGWTILLAAASLAGCGGEPACLRCDTLVIAATGEPSALLPPIVGDAVGRDVSDLVFERLMVLEGGGSPVDEGAFAPAIARRWERVDSTTLRFVLRNAARWHDGTPLTSADVVFSFAAYVDTALGAPAGSALGGRVSAHAETDSTVLVRFTAPDPEQLYDATWHVRVIPRHLWESVPMPRWAEDTALTRLVGSGPYRVGQWVKGQSLTLERVDTAATAPPIRRVVWRFAGDQDAALNLILSHEADLLESIGDSSRVARVESDTSLRTVQYPAAVYGFLGFNLAGTTSSPLRDPRVRRALFQGTDRATAARAVYGPTAQAPPGPMSGILWINDDSIRTLAFDTGAASRGLAQAGWNRIGATRRRQGRDLIVDILVPATSVARRNLAQIVQEQWRSIGVSATISSVDFPVFQERLRTGRFESFVGAWLDEPSPRGLADQWTSAGVGGLNYGKYRNHAFDALVTRALTTAGDASQARRAWRAALDTLNADAPAIWLYTPVNVAAVSSRVEGVRIDPYSWLTGLTEWRLGPARP